MSVLEKATQILDVVAESPEAATLTSIAQRLGRPRSSTHRLLSELVQLGLLLRVGPANYAPGPRLARWGEAAGGFSDIVRLSKSAMVRLRDEVNYELRHFTEVGKPLPLSVGASGKVLLAFADQATQAQELRRVAREPLTPRAPTADELVVQLEQIRLTGWSTSFGEREEGLAAAAVPIWNQAGAVNAALSISGPTARLTAERLEGLRKDLSAAAAGISRAQGWGVGEATPRTGTEAPASVSPAAAGH